MSLWPQFAILICYALTFALHAEKAGKPREPYSPIIALINAAIGVFILWKGGFFVGFGWGS